MSPCMPSTRANSELRLFPFGVFVSLSLMLLCFVVVWGPCTVRPWRRLAGAIAAVPPMPCV